MIDVATRRDQTFAVFGLGVSGLATAHALAASGARIIAWDDNEFQRGRVDRTKVAVEDLRGRDFGNIDALVVSPGVPLTHRPHPIVARARETATPIIGDIELLIESCPQARFVGITGTNGKSTTTALLGHILERAGVPTQIGGNLGPPVLAFDPPEPGEAIVLELSSFQLDLTEYATVDVAVLLNISPDHLDRHGSMAGYIAAKQRIFRTRTGDREDRQIAIIGIDDAHCRALHADMRLRPGWTTIPVSVETRPGDGVYVANGVLFDERRGEARRICDLSGIVTLRGPHNWQNAAAAYAAACALGIAEETIARAFLTYPGLPHRLEPVATIGGVRYVNDSKATNGEAAARAIACFDAVYWIAGGRAKEDGIVPVLPVLGRVRHAFLIGEAADAFEETLDGRVPVTQARDLATALSAAAYAASIADDDDPVVLLSPAAASYDQWKNFEARGDAFRALVRARATEATQ